MQELNPAAREGAGPSRIPVELEAFFMIAEKWKLSTDEQIRLLGSPGRSTFFKWKKDGGAVPVDTTERISHLLGIWKSLKILFPLDDRSYDWIRQPNQQFDGESREGSVAEGERASGGGAASSTTDAAAVASS